MPTLRRILKYAPAVVMGLLVVAWVVSLVAMFGGNYRYGNCEIGGGVTRGTIGGGVGSAQPNFPDGWSWALHPRKPSTFREVAGQLLVYTELPQFRWCCALYLPFLLLITLITPLAIGPFISFRFRLWHYLAYTALVAVELAYYLRWQE
jgi:hypothetical protein